MKKVTSTQNRSFFVIYLLDSANLSCATIDICSRVRAWGISNKCMTPVISGLVLTGGLVWLRTYPKLGTNRLKLRNESTSFWVRNGRGTISPVGTISPILPVVRVSCDHNVVVSRWSRSQVVLYTVVMNKSSRGRFVIAFHSYHGHISVLSK